MAKSRVRKHKKKSQVDAAGNLTTSHTKKHVQSAKRAMMMRALTLQNASNSLSAAELNILLDSAIKRKDFYQDKKEGIEVRPAKPVMKYTETKLDENGVPMGGNTKEIELSNADIPRLTQIAKMKEQAEEQVEEQVQKTEAK